MVNIQISSFMIRRKINLVASIFDNHWRGLRLDYQHLVRWKTKGAMKEVQVVLVSSLPSMCQVHEDHGGSCLLIPFSNCNSCPRGRDVLDSHQKHSQRGNQHLVDLHMLSLSRSEPHLGDGSSCLGELFRFCI